MSTAITVTRPAPGANLGRQPQRRRSLRAAVLLATLVLAALAIGLVAGEHLQAMGAADWPLQVWINGEELGGGVRAQLAGSGLGAASALGLGLLTLVVLAVLLPLLLGLTVALPLLLTGLVLLGVTAGLVALMGLPLLLLGLVALPLLLPVLLLWWAVRWIVR